MNATVSFSGLDVWQLGRLIRAAERAGGLPAPVVRLGGEVDLWLTDNGCNRIQVIKAIREATGLGLKEAKDLTECGPVAVVKNVPPVDVKRLRGMFESAGAVVEFRDVSGIVADGGGKAGG